jgi:membrane associated rhomboid family serine protease
LIPYKDDNPTAIFPFVTIALIVINILVFLWQVAAPEGLMGSVFAYGAVPTALLKFESQQPVHPAATVFTSMFMHGGILHIAGNMLYLWIFGNNIEDKLGHVKFIIFYLFGGVVAAYAHALSSPGSNIPMVGASGAVAAVLGAYLLLFPRASVYTIIFLGFFVPIVKLPALIVIGFWAIIQFVNGIVEKGILAEGGVAWFAHIGGFLFGVIVVLLFVPRNKKPKRKILWL